MFNPMNKILRYCRNLVLTRSSTSRLQLGLVRHGFNLVAGIGSQKYFDGSQEYRHNIVFIMTLVPPCAAVKTSSAIWIWRTALHTWDTSKLSSEMLCCVSFNAFIVNLFRTSMCKTIFSIPNWGRKISE